MQILLLGIVRCSGYAVKAKRPLWAESLPLFLQKATDLYRAQIGASMVLACILHHVGSSLVSLCTTLTWKITKNPLT